MSVKAWKDFWAAIPGWLRQSIMLALAGTAASGVTLKMKADDHLKNELAVQLAPMQRKMDRMDAGFRALITTFPAKTQVIVFRAEDKADRKDEVE